MDQELYKIKNKLQETCMSGKKTNQTKEQNLKIKIKKR